MPMPDYNTWVNFDEDRSFTTSYQTGDTCVFDDYVFSIQSANMTINALFDDNDILTFVINGTSGSTSIVTINPSASGRSSEPTEVIMIDGENAGTSNSFADETYTLNTIHSTDNITYQINWATGSSGTGVGGGGTLPPVVDDDSVADDDVIDDTDNTPPVDDTPEGEEPQTSNDYSLLIIVIVFAIIALLIVGYYYQDN